MEACSNKQCNLDIRIAASQFSDHMRQDILTRNRTCVVTDNDCTVRFALGKFVQMWAVDRVIHGFFHNFIAIFVTLESVNVGC